MVTVRRLAGFTLVELMVALAVAAILAGLAAPSFSEMIANQRAKSVATDLYIALTKARSEALKRNVSVSLTPKTADQWHGGWQILDPADSTRALHARGAAAGVAIDGPDEVTYRSSGRLDAGTAPSFDVTASGASYHWCISVDLSGRPYTEKKATC
ncbi:GspH/FimT family pseudopilin [Noviherbaspirillum aridicola]|uniref:Type II secretion system protein H n=1 Tax=Noviherbaspirillum aridicola TaxID=2849687 RepID=A0ABQ4QB11_9BURK|nr:GspH/FimT family pseudopilin [Noviherbaspirillum aridicola]GIZ53869.1 hypothetical protein NCCP691_38830 [Noviherbaspirillum aridicola]